MPMWKILSNLLGRPRRPAGLNGLVPVSGNTSNAIIASEDEVQADCNREEDHGEVYERIGDTEAVHRTTSEGELSMLGAGIKWSFARSQQSH